MVLSLSIAGLIVCSAIASLNHSVVVGSFDGESSLTAKFAADRDADPERMGIVRLIETGVEGENILLGAGPDEDNVYFAVRGEKVLRWLSLDSRKLVRWTPFPQEIRAVSTSRTSTVMATKDSVYTKKFGKKYSWDRKPWTLNDVGDVFFGQGPLVVADTDWNSGQSIVAECEWHRIIGGATRAFGPLGHSQLVLTRDPGGLATHMQHYPQRTIWKRHTRTGSFAAGKTNQHAIWWDGSTVQLLCEEGNVQWESEVGGTGEKWVLSSPWSNLFILAEWDPETETTKLQAFRELELNCIAVAETTLAFRPAGLEFLPETSRLVVAEADGTVQLRQLPEGGWVGSEPKSGDMIEEETLEAALSEIRSKSSS